jgi:hypothetical protein
MDTCVSHFCADALGAPTAPAFLLADCHDRRDRGWLRTKATPGFRLLRASALDADGDEVEDEDEVAAEDVVEGFDAEEEDEGGALVAHHLGKRTHVPREPALLSVTPHAVLATSDAVRAVFRAPLNRGFVARLFGWGAEAGGATPEAGAVDVERLAMGGETRVRIPWTGLSRLLRHTGITTLLIPFAHARAIFLDSIGVEGAVCVDAVERNFIPPALVGEDFGATATPNPPTASSLAPPALPLLPWQACNGPCGLDPGLTFWSFELFLALVALRSGPAAGDGRHPLTHDALARVAHDIPALLAFMDLRGGRTGPGPPPRAGMRIGQAQDF